MDTNDCIQVKIERLCLSQKSLMTGGHEVSAKVNAKWQVKHFFEYFVKSPSIA